MRGDAKGLHAKTQRLVAKGAKETGETREIQWPVWRDWPVRALSHGEVEREAREVYGDVDEYDAVLRWHCGL